MLKLSPSVSLTFGLVTLTVLLFLAVDLGLGVVPNEEQNTIDMREKVSINLALQLGSMVQTDDNARLIRIMGSIQERNDDILSIAVRHVSGELIAQSGFHLKYWVPPPENQSTMNHVQVPLLRDNHQWANMEISFQPQGDGSYIEVLKNPSIALPLSFILGGSIFYYLYLRRALQHLDPTKVVPDRVSNALETLTEGVMIMDTRGRVMLVNDGFKRLHRDAEKVEMGQKISGLSWLTADFENTQSEAPWTQALQTQQSIVQQPLRIPKGFNGDRELMVNASPILDGNGKLRGCMVSLQDVTELHRAMHKIEAQNKTLHHLANYDQLTGMYNRRAFFEKGERSFDEYKESQKPLACIMCDIDHFKLINDNHGHGAGDEGIRAVTMILRDAIRSSDMAGRYGGEEFCIVLPGANEEIALRVSERIRSQIETEAGKGVTSVPDLKITSSFGIAMLNPENATLSDLIDQADQALYVSKEGGRNRVSVYSPEMKRG
jgi:diguanylate cyclase (GGDEF)-like protein/PAS domain S-box-containing protein